jgi:hypothetical protein
MKLCSFDARDQEEPRRSLLVKEDGLEDIQRFTRS